MRAETVPAWEALNARLVAHRYETRWADTGGYNCRKITGGSRYSLHAYGIAVDINWSSNPYGRNLVTDMPAAMVADIKGITTVDGKRVFRWGGDYKNNKDAMHFEIVASPSELRAGIAGVRGVAPLVAPDQVSEDESMKPQLFKDPKKQHWIVLGLQRNKITPKSALTTAALHGIKLEELDANAFAYLVDITTEIK